MDNKVPDENAVSWSSYFADNSINFGRGYIHYNFGSAIDNVDIPGDCRDLCLKSPYCLGLVWFDEFGLDSDKFFQCQLKYRVDSAANIWYRPGWTMWLRDQTTSDNRYMFGYAYKGNDLNNMNVYSLSTDCQDACLNMPGCQGFTWYNLDHPGKSRIKVELLDLGKNFIFSRC